MQTAFGGDPVGGGLAGECLLLVAHLAVNHHFIARGMGHAKEAGALNLGPEVHVHVHPVVCGRYVGNGNDGRGDYRHSGLGIGDGTDRLVAVVRGHTNGGGFRRDVGGDPEFEPFKIRTRTAPSIQVGAAVLSSNLRLVTEKSVLRPPCIPTLLDFHGLRFYDNRKCAGSAHS